MIKQVVILADKRSKVRGIDWGKRVMNVLF